MPHIYGVRRECSTIQTAFMTQNVTQQFLPCCGRPVTIDVARDTEVICCCCLRLLAVLMNMVLQSMSSMVRNHHAIALPQHFRSLKGLGALGMDKWECFVHPSSTF
eukprot:267713-Amphidinium_carterae.2